MHYGNGLCIVGEACALWEWSVCYGRDLCIMGIAWCILGGLCIMGSVYYGRGLHIMGMTSLLWEWPVYYGRDLFVVGGACVLWERSTMHPFLASVETEFKDKFRHSVTAL